MDGYTEGRVDQSDIRAIETREFIEWVISTRKGGKGRSRVEIWLWIENEGGYITIWRENTRSVEDYSIEGYFNRKSKGRDWWVNIANK